MTVVKIGKRKIDLDSYLCDRCKIPCVIISYPKPHQCPFGWSDDVDWVEKKIKVEKKGDS